MTTGTTIVTDAMSRCGVFGLGDTLTPEDAQLVLRSLNRLMDSWSNMRSMVWEVFYDTFPTVAGTAAYASSVLASGTRPVKVVSMRVSRGGIDYPVELIDNGMWESIPYKASKGTPEFCYVQTSTPTVTFNFYPVPEAIYTASVGCHRPLPSTLALTTTLAFPPGYEKAIVDSLAVDIAGSFGRPVSAQMKESEREAKSVLRTANYVPSKLSLGGGGDTPLERLYRG